MTKTAISQDDYLRLVGLLTLAADHCRALRDIERAACGITGDEDDVGSHTGDAVWGGDRTADQLLDVIGITVEQPTTTPQEAGEQARQAMDITRRFNDP